MTAMHPPPDVLLVASAVVLIGVLAAAFADRLSAPALLLFLGLGMLLGEDGPGGIEFDDFELAEALGSAALALILFEGGLAADRRTMRRVLVPAGLLATVGVVVTAAVVACASWLVLGLDWKHSLLVGAVVSSTDAAAVFAAVRGLPLRRRLSATLELESGINDPFAAVMVVVLVEIATSPSVEPVEVAQTLVKQLAIGAVGGYVAGRVSAAVLTRISLPSAGLYPAATTGLALGTFALVASLGGSGFLAVYLLGLAIGGAHLPHGNLVSGFHEGTGWLAQIGLFVFLGLLVDPSRLPEQGLEPIVVALVLVLVARPLAVVVSTLRQGFQWREKAFLSWAGLRGAVPVVFATFPVVGGVTGALELFDVVFYVVVVSVIVQGIGLRRVAAALGVADDVPAVRLADIDVGTLRSLGAELVELEAGQAGVEAGRALRDVTFPGGGIVAAIRRGDAIVPPRGSTVIEPGDRLYVLVERERIGDVERALNDE
jgi:cell volume regulation protein A